MRFWPGKSSRAEKLRVLKLDCYLEPFGDKICRNVIRSGNGSFFFLIKITVYRYLEVEKEFREATISDLKIPGCGKGRGPPPKAVLQLPHLGHLTSPQMGHPVT